MAENADRAAAPHADRLENLHLDEVTGERVSKSELKKRAKQRQTDAKKAEKESQRLAAAQKEGAPTHEKKPAEDDETQLSAEQYHAIRSLRVAKWKEASDPNPYPHKFHVKTDLRQFLKDYAGLAKGETREDVTVQLAGRVYTKRASGSKLLFYDIRAENVKVQAMCQVQFATGARNFEAQHEHIRRGDIVGIIGFPGRTAPRTRDDGELSIFVKELVLLAPCLHQLPSEHFGLKGEARFRNRPLDLILNDRSRETLIARARIVKFLRRFLDDRDFLEVETPSMTKIVGGATAKPFLTHHNDLDMDLYMRVAPELSLKELVIGGLERVYEIGKQYRNESIDLTHNPEFTTLEYYQAYADMYDLIDTTEEMLSSLVYSLKGSYKTTYNTVDGKELTINWEKPWRRIDMIEELEKVCGEKFPPGDQLGSQESNDFLKAMLKKMNVECPPPLTTARMIDKLVGEFVETQCISPTFLSGTPLIMSPLAKYSRDRPGIAERFELFVATKELVNAYTELNDPFVQRMNFEEQAQQKAAGDDEAQVTDEEFLAAMELGLPPTGGWGMGIDRLVMFLTDNYSIKEVLAFPMMKDENVKRTEKPAAQIAGVEPIYQEGIPHK